MPTNSVNSDINYWMKPSSDNTQGGAKSTKGASNLSDFNSFMKILSTQLKNQDPSKPMSNTEYVSQMAQIQTLSQLQNMSNNISANSAYSLIGKSVAYLNIDAVTGAVTPAVGKVDAVLMKDNTAYLSVNGKAVKVSEVQAVTSGTPDPKEPAKV